MALTSEQVEVIVAESFKEEDKLYVTGLIDGFRFSAIITEEQWTDLMNKYVWNPPAEVLALLEE